MSKSAAVVRVVLGVGWCLIGLSKLMLPDELAYARAAHRLAVTAQFVKVGFLSIAAAEVLLGVILLLRPRRPAGPHVSMILASVFLVYSAWAGSARDSCGCMGRAVWLGGMPRFGVALVLLLCSWWLLRACLPVRQMVVGIPPTAPSSPRGAPLPSPRTGDPRAADSQ